MNYQKFKINIMKRELDYKIVKNNIRQNLKEYIIKYNLKSLVLGISGGIDSALCAALAKPICDELGIKIIGRSITISTNKKEEIDRARMIGKAFCHDFKEVDLSNSFNELYKNISEEISSDDIFEKINQGNAKARLRMIYLYDLARKNKGLVLSTDNYTELMVGFWSLHGDVGDYGMIQSLWKTEVYNLAIEINSEQQDKLSLKLCIDATPTDGLGITNSDLDQLGASSYAEVDGVLIKYLHGTPKEVDEVKNHEVIKRHLSTSFKRNNPYNIPISELLS